MAHRKTYELIPHFIRAVRLRNNSLILGDDGRSVLLGGFDPEDRDRLRREIGQGNRLSLKFRVCEFRGFGVNRELEVEKSFPNA